MDGLRRSRLLREHNKCWTLADDSALCTLLEDFERQLVARTKELSGRLDEIGKNSVLIDAAVENINCSLDLLSSTQFVEQKIGEEEHTRLCSNGMERKIKNMEERQADALIFVQRVISDGLHLMDNSVEDSFNKELFPQIDSSDFYCWQLNAVPTVSNEMSSDQQLTGGSQISRESTTNSTAHASVKHAEPIVTDAVRAVPKTDELVGSKPSTLPKPLLESADEQTTRPSPHPSHVNAGPPVPDMSKFTMSKSTKDQLVSSVPQDGQSDIHASGDANGAKRRSPNQTLKAPHSSRLFDETESEDDDIFTEARRVVSQHKSLEESVSSRSNPSTKPSLSNSSFLVVDVENSIEEVGAESAKGTSISENGPVRKVPQLGDIQKAQANLKKSSIKESGVQPVPKLEKEIRREQISEGTIGRSIQEVTNASSENDHGSTYAKKNENPSPAVAVRKQTQEKRKISEAPKKSLFDSDSDSDSDLFTVVRRPIQHPVHVAPPSSQNTTTAKPSVERGGQQGTDQPLLKPQTATAKSASGNVSPAAPKKESQPAPKKKGLFDSDSSDLDELFSTSKKSATSSASLEDKKPNKLVTSQKELQGSQQVETGKSVPEKKSLFDSESSDLEDLFKRSAGNKSVAAPKTALQVKEDYAPIKKTVSSPTPSQSTVPPNSETKAAGGSLVVSESVAPEHKVVSEFVATSLIEKPLEVPTSPVRDHFEQKGLECDSESPKTSEAAEVSPPSFSADPPGGQVPLNTADSQNSRGEEQNPAADSVSVIRTTEEAGRSVVSPELVEPPSASTNETGHCPHFEVPEDSDRHYSTGQEKSKEESSVESASAVLSKNSAVHLQDPTENPLSETFDSGWDQPPELPAEFGKQQQSYSSLSAEGSDSDEMSVRGKLNSSFANKLNATLSKPPPIVGLHRTKSANDELPNTTPAIVPPLRKTSMSSSASEKSTKESNLFDNNPQLLHSVTKGRVRGPARRPPSKSALRMSESSDSENVATKPGPSWRTSTRTTSTRPRSAISTEELERKLSSNKLNPGPSTAHPETVNVQRKTSNSKESTEKRTSSPISSTSNKTAEPVPKTKSLFESDSSDEDLFRKKATNVVGKKAVSVRPETITSSKNAPTKPPAPKNAADRSVASKSSVKPLSVPQKTTKKLFDDSSDSDLDLFRKKP